MKTNIVYVSLLLIIVVFAQMVNGSQFLGPRHYLSFADSPYAELDLSFFQLDDFEDGALNTPGVASTAGRGVLALNYMDYVGTDRQRIVFLKIADTHTPIPGGEGTFTDFGGFSVGPSFRDGAEKKKDTHI